MGHEAATVVEDDEPLEETTDDVEEEDDVEDVEGAGVDVELVVDVVVVEVELETAIYAPTIIIKMMITTTPIKTFLESALRWPNFILGKEL
jgi:hypothetical protein